MSLPASLQAEVLESIRNLDGEEAWGAEPRPPDGILADPGILLDRLFPHITALLDTIMRLTPVEQLPGVSLQPINLQPPTPDADTPYDM